ncbi:uncharacterized protein NPIL_665821 [Nephila pilipes]|uniref:Uncharacterized protein n=1 Tax=Nephila pilipes TaxID=299642 RepID=A0A8X6UIN7_NEPPI|nr:uncharacterized protein NPIL_665821 [Nephila pilipes]
MGRQLRVQRPPIRNISDLRDRCLNILYNLSPVIYQGLVASMPRRVEAVLRAKGGTTRYGQVSVGTESRTRTTPWVHPTTRRQLTMNELNKRNIQKMLLSWKLFKIIIFVACVACFSLQSANFFKLYFTYPTVTSIDLTFPAFLKNPTFTLCNTNPVKREKFCGEYPYLCQKPNNLTEFCKKHPYFCKHNTSNLVIPKVGYYAKDSKDEVRDALLEIYMHNISKDGPEYWSWSFPYDFEQKRNKITTTFSFDYSKSDYVTCYSTNLHINSNKKIETTKSHASVGVIILNHFHSRIDFEETMYPWTVPQIILSIHSPFVPVYAFYEGEILQTDHVYMIKIRMEEEHLLESPYQTNCTDYDGIWEKNNKTGPRSQEMCREWCKWNYFKTYVDCNGGMIMIENSRNLCNTEENSLTYYKDREVLENCLNNCKVNCRKLIYHYEITDRVQDPFERKSSDDG